MKKRLIIIISLIGCLVLAFAGLLKKYQNKEFKASFKELVVFGDSWSDQGNVYIQTHQTYPVDPYFDGRFSNGKIWVELFAEKMGLNPPSPRLKGGTNYAFGGARSGNGYKKGKPNMGAQVEMYLKDVKDSVPKHTLIVLWGGGNDFFGGSPFTIIRNLVYYIKRLAQAGATQFLIPNFAPLSCLPVFTNELPLILEEGMVQSIDAKIYEMLQDKFGSTITSTLKKWVPTFREYIESLKAYFPFLAEYIGDHISTYTGNPVSLEAPGQIIFNCANNLTDMYNDYLRLALIELEKDLNIKVYKLDAHKTFLSILNNSEAFGIKFINETALDPQTKKIREGKEPSLYMFFDGLHPSSTVHEVLANTAMELFR